MNDPLVSILVPTCNRSASLDRALRSLSQLDYPADRLEVLVIDDGSTDDTRRIATEAAARYGADRFRYAYVPKGNIVQAKNRGVALARGDFLVFTDDDCTFDPTWLRRLLAPFADPDVGAAGGADRCPPDAPPFSAAVDYALTGLLGSGGVRSGRSGPRVAAFYPRGCNMAIRKHVLEEIGPFDPRFFNGEEIDVDYRIAAAGHRLACAADCCVWHHRRATPAGLVRQVFGRGVARRMLFRKHPERGEPGYLLPAALLLYWIAGGAAALYWPAFRPVFLASVLAYAGLLLAGGIHGLAQRRRPRAAAHVPAVLLLQHLAYGAGVLAAPLHRAYRSLANAPDEAERGRSALTFLVSNDGYGPNQGDRAILQSMQAEFRRTFPGVRMRGFLNAWSPTPAALLRFWRDLRWADVFVFGGGQVLHDQTCFLFLLAGLAKLWTARLAGTPAVCYAIGAGPIASRLGRSLTRRTLNRLDLIIVRDPTSKALLEGLGVRRPAIHVTADAAFLLPDAPDVPVAALLPPNARTRGDRPLIALCPRRWFHYTHAFWPARWKRQPVPPAGRRRFEELLDVFAAAIGRLCSELDAHVLLVPMKSATRAGDPGQDDDRVCAEILERVRDPEHVSILTAALDPGSLREVLGAAHCVVSMRMHAVILAMSRGVPGIGIGLTSKFADLFRAAQMEDFLLAPEQVSSDRLCDLVRLALREASTRGPHLRAEADALAARAAGSVTLFRDWVAQRIPERIPEPGKVDAAQSVDTSHDSR